MERESLKSRLGFVLVSAGCAIGMGNVWRFPYVVGTNGGGAFVFFYVLFLLILGMPILTMEFAMGRRSRKSIACVYEELAPNRKAWQIHSLLGSFGNYVLMSFYTNVSGWMMNYFFKYLTGSISTTSMEETTATFTNMMANPAEMLFWMIIVVVLGILICSLGVQKGVERISKMMMVALLGIIVILAINSLMLPGMREGLRFYFYPDFNEIVEDIGIGNVISAAMNQSFFTLSLGVGSMLIFGSYMNKERTLLGESINIAILDTFVAVLSGIIIFPACFSYGVEPGSGPSLIFMTIPKIFAEMSGGRIWGILFFLFMTFAALSTIVAVFENIISIGMDRFGWSRKKSAFINLFVLTLVSIPCALGFNVLSFIEPLGAGKTILDLEDFIISNLLLPFGTITIVLFCTTRYGWGFDNYIEEANTGKGLKVPRWIYGYCKYVIPIIVFVIFVQNMISVFNG